MTGFWFTRFLVSKGFMKGLPDLITVFPVICFWTNSVQLILVASSKNNFFDFRSGALARNTQLNGVKKKE